MTSVCETDGSVRVEIHSDAFSISYRCPWCKGIETVERPIAAALNRVFNGGNNRE